MSADMQLILQKIGNLETLLATHKEREESMAAQVSIMYKLFIVGNGSKSYQEIIREHTDWIAEQKARQKQEDERTEDRRRRKDDRRWSVKLQWISQAIGIPIAIILLIISIFFGK